MTTLVLGRYPINAVIRTSSKYDRQVRHLGYEPIDIEPGTELGAKGFIPTDVEVVKEAQKRLRGVKVVPDEKLTPPEISHLQLARGITADLVEERVLPLIHAAEIPPASDRVRTAGLYARSSRAIYISREQLKRGRNTVDTIIHEIAHHTSGAEDGEEKHKIEMQRIAGIVVNKSISRAYDRLLKAEGVIW